MWSRDQPGSNLLLSVSNDFSISDIHYFHQMEIAEGPEITDPDFRQRSIVPAAVHEHGESLTEEENKKYGVENRWVRSVVI